MKKILVIMMFMLTVFTLMACKDNPTPEVTTYDVTFNADNGSTAVVVSVDEGEVVSQPADPLKDGYTFIEWQLSGAAYNFDTIVTADITLIAKYEETAFELNEATLQVLTAEEVAVYMGNGINLGNTMEAWGREEEYLGTDSAVSEYEQFWGQPITTAAMIEGMKAEGFDTLRIPVAWTNMMDYESKDYTIDPAYLARVAEIVNYALDADMFVIVNDHWDGGWWGMFGSATESVREDAMDLYTSMWTQIGNYFKDYSYKLILESANEELGDRLNDDDIAEDSGWLDTYDAKYAKANEINQAFVDTIRDTGGKNVDRFLLIAGYNTDITMTDDDRFDMPTDTASSKLLLSVHYYTPWTYCGTSGIAVWGSEIQYNTQNDLLEMMTKYTDQGYAIVIGEWGVFPQSDGNLKANTDEFFDNFLNNCDLYGYVPVLWDTNSFYDKENTELRYELLSDIFTSRNVEAESSLTREDITQNATNDMAAALVMAHERDEEGGVSIEIGVSYAWLMYTDADWAVSFSVGDTFNPSDITVGATAVYLLIEEAGTYTVSIDFTGTSGGYANGLGFAALGLSFGEDNFEGNFMNVTSIVINGEAIALSKILYTTSDDEHCTRVNLYNPWVSQPITDGRTQNPNLLQFATAQLLDPDTIGDEQNRVYTIEITFNLVVPEA